MEFIKHHKVFFIITFLFFVIATVLYYNWLQIEFKRVSVQNKINELQKHFNDLLLFDYKLEQNNVDASVNNVIVAKQFYKKFKKSLIDKYTIFLSAENLRRKRPVDVKRNLTVRIKHFLDNLSNKGIEVDGDLTFGKYIGKQSIPPLIEEVELIYKHLFIVQFLIDILSGEDISKILHFKRPNGLVFKKLKYYNVSRYVLKILGQPSSLKRVINQLSNNNKLFFLIKKAELSSSLKIIAPKKHDEKKEILSEVKFEKLVNPFKIDTTTLSLVFDVYDFGD